jgi:hypothetical protein
MFASPAFDLRRKPSHVPVSRSPAGPHAGRSATRSPVGPWSFSAIHLRAPGADAARVDQATIDGKAQDGDDSYPRQGPVPQPDGPAPAPAGGGAGTPAGTYATAPTVPQILADTVMAAQLQRAWVEANPNAPDVPNGGPGSLKREQGGWFLWRRDSHILQNIRVGPGSRDGLPTIVGTRPPDSDIQQVVAWFHTHPNKSTEGYTSPASPGDINWQKAEAKVPGIIMTHDGVVTIPYP